MSADTDAYEVDPRVYQDLGREMDERKTPFNGSSRFVNFMLTLIALLLSSAIGGAIVMVNDVAAIKVQVRDLQEKVDLIINGHIRIPGQ